MPKNPTTSRRHDQVGAGDVARAEQAQRHQRVRDPRLADDEAATSSDRDGAEAERLQRAPALLGPASSIV